MKKTFINFSVIAVLVIALFTITYTSFAFWDNLEDQQNNVIQLGEGTEIIVEATTANIQERLVPVGVVKGIGDTDNVEFCYEVCLSKNSVTDLALHVEVLDVYIGEEEDENKLVQFEIVIGNEGYVSADPTEVTVNLSLRCPKSNYEYELLSNKPIHFKLQFTAFFDI